MKKKWYVINHRAGGNLFYMIEATEEEIAILERLIDNDAEYGENCLYYDFYWGNFNVVSPGFDTREECEEYFKTAEEFCYFK